MTSQFTVSFPHHPASPLNCRVRLLSARMSPVGNGELRLIDMPLTSSCSPEGRGHPSCYGGPGGSFLFRPFELVADLPPAGAGVSIFVFLLPGECFPLGCWRWEAGLKLFASGRELSARGGRSQREILDPSITTLPQYFHWLLPNHIFKSIE